MIAFGRHVKLKMAFSSSLFLRHNFIFTFSILMIMSALSILFWDLNLTTLKTKAILEKLRVDFQNLPSSFSLNQSGNEHRSSGVFTSNISTNSRLFSPPGVVFEQKNLDLRLDKRKRNRTDLLEELADSIRTLPRPPFLTEQWATTYINETCAISPSILDVQFVNKYWQVVKKQLGTLFLYGAYYDNRNLTMNELTGPAVRILGVMDRYLELEPNATNGYCQLRFENETEPIITKITERHYMWYDYQNGGNNSRLHPYIFTCPIPPSHHAKVPISMSVVENACDNAPNNLGVQHSMALEKKPFAVCVKGLHLPQEDNLSIRLVEWIELMRLLGAEKIFLYEYQVHPNISKVMQYYQSTGFVDVTPITLPGYLPGDPRLAHLYHTSSNHEPENWMLELIPLNDCLYRNLNNYEYLAVVDTDEVMMPLGNMSTWHELLKELETQNPVEFREVGGILFRNVYFLDIFMNNRPFNPDIPWYMHALQHVYRASNHSQATVAAKSFNKVDRVLIINNHWPRSCLGGWCKYLHVNETMGQLQHYKPKCPHYVRNCMERLGNETLDTAIWKYKDKLIEKAEAVLQTLGFISVPRSNSSWLLLQVPNNLLHF